MDKELLHKNLIVCILALASDKQSQISYTTPGCVVCDLIEDFETYGKRCFETANYSTEECELIGELNLLIDQLIELGYECFDTDVLDSMLWNEIRAKASSALSKFGYRIIPLPQSIETQLGVWKIDISKYDLVRSTSK